MLLQDAAEDDFGFGAKKKKKKKVGFDPEVEEQTEMRDRTLLIVT